MSVRLPRKSELPWGFRPAAQIAGLAMLAGLVLTWFPAGYARAKPFSDVSPHGPLPFLAAAAFVAGLFTLGVVLGLLAGCTATAGFDEHMARLVEYYRRPPWPFLIGVLDGDFRRAVRVARPLGIRVVRAVLALTTLAGAVLAAGFIDHAVTGTPSGAFLAYLGYIVGYMCLPPLLWVLRLPE